MLQQYEIVTLFIGCAVNLSVFMLSVHLKDVEITDITYFSRCNIIVSPLQCIYECLPYM